MRITVVGAGVIGLTTAHALEEDGHEVRIIAAATGARTTSDVAGAVWFPYRCGPPARVALWASITRSWLERFADDRDAGIDVLRGFEITQDEGPDPPRPWWAAHVDVERAPAPVTGRPAAWAFTAPRVEPRRFLPWLTRQVRARIEERVVTDLDDVPGDLVVNCTGLGARDLTGDDRLVPLFGQILVTEPGAVDLTVTVTDHRDVDRVFYVIPRRDELVLGGCTVPWTPGAPTPTDAAVTARVLAQATEMGLAPGAIRIERTGLRPYRDEVRLERDPRAPRVIHNYGHGGAGFTLCRGCAEDVVRIVATIEADGPSPVRAG